MAWDKQDDEEWQRHVQRSREDTAWAKNYRDSAEQGSAGAQASKEAREGNVGSLKEAEESQSPPGVGASGAPGGASLNGAEKSAAATQGGLFRKAGKDEKLTDRPLGGWVADNLSFKALKGMSGRRKALLLAAAGTGLLGLAGGWLGIFNLLNIFQLDHLMRNIEGKAFVRYQVDMDGRSKKWIASYIKLRMGEVDDPSQKPEDRDNMIFRAREFGEEDMNGPFYKWYKLMRSSSSKFEQELFEKEGVKFGSVAYKDGNQIKFRPALITIDSNFDGVNDATYKFELTAAERNALEKGNINQLNGRINRFVDTTVMSEKDARKAIKQAVHRNTKFYQVSKRLYLRKSIQNATGVRDWRVYDTLKPPCIYDIKGGRKNAAECAESKIALRNKLVAKAFPESTKSGKFIQCMFGITSCKTTTDPNDPATRSALASVSESCSEGTETDCNTSKTDAEGNPIPDEQTAENGLKEGVDGELDANTQSLTRKILTKLLDKINGATAIISIIDTINNINNSMKSGALSNMVYVARAAANIGIFQVMMTSVDQARTGDLSAEDMNTTVDIVAENAGNSEGWRTVVGSGTMPTVTAAATEVEATQERKRFCSPEFQEAMLLPNNEAAAKSSFAYLCAFEKIGGDNLAKDIEDGWNNSIGIIVGPILAVYEGSGLAAINSWIGDAVDAVFGDLISSITQGVLGALGLADDVKSLMGWLMGKIASMLGAGPVMSESAPPGVWANHALLGASASAEHASRFAGAAATATLSLQDKQEAQKRVYAYQQEVESSKSFNQKYFSLSEYDSVASNALFALVNQPVSTTVATSFSSLANLPTTVLSGRASAAAVETGYEAAKFGGVETYDQVNVCMTQEPETMTPASSTNADDLGLIDKEELTWEVLSDDKTFWPKVFESDPGDKAKRVYNCAMLDSVVSGSLGAKFAPDTIGPNAYGVDAAAAAVPTAGGEGLPQGTAQELAKLILNNNNIRFQLPEQRRAMEYIAENGKGRQCGASAINPKLLGVMLLLAEKYKMVYGVLIDGHHCNGGFHPRGMAVDINGITTLDGKRKVDDGSHVRFTSNDQPLLKEFYEVAGPILSTEIGGGGLGQTDCMQRKNMPAKAPKVAYFPNDSCNHIHLDIGKR